MSTERFDVIVTDKIDESIEKRLNAIGVSAVKTYSAIEDLKKSLGQLTLAGNTFSNSQAKSAAEADRQTKALIDQEAATQRAVRAKIAAEVEAQKLAATATQASIAIGKLAAQNQVVATATANSMAAQVRAQDVLKASQTQAKIEAERLAKAQAQTSTANNQAAVTAQKLAEAQANATAAVANATTANNNAALSAQKLAQAQIQTANASQLAGTQAAVAAQRLATSQQQTQTATAQAATAATQAATAAQRLALAQAQAQAAALRLAQAQARASAASQTAASAQGAAMQSVGNSSNLMTMRIQNAGYQVNDFFVQIQGGQNVMLAFSQQFTQLVGAFGMWGAIAAAGVAIGSVVAQMIMGQNAAKKYTMSLEALEYQQDQLTNAGRTYREGMDDEARKLNDLIAGYNNLSQARQQAVRTQQIQIQANLQRERDNLIAQIGGQGWNMRDVFGTNVREYANSIKELQNAMANLDRTTESGRLEYQLYQNQLDQFSRQQMIAAEAYNKLREGGVLNNETLAALINEYTRAINIGGPWTDNLKAQRDALLALVPEVDKNANAIMTSISIINQAIPGLQNYSATAGNAADNVRRLREAQEQLTKQIEAAKNANPTANLEQQLAGYRAINEAFRRGGPVAGRREEARQRVATDARTMADNAISQRTQELTRAGMSSKEAQQQVEGERAVIEATAQAVAVERERAAQSRITASETAKSANEAETLQNRLASLVNSVDKTTGAQLMMEKGERTLQEALRSGLITREDYNKYIELTTRFYTEQANPLQTIIRNLNDEKRLLGLTSDEREVEQRLLQITEQLRQRGHILSQTEIDDLRKRLTGIQQSNQYQQIYNNLLQQAEGPQRAYNMTLEAANKLYNEGKISADQYQTAVVTAQNAVLAQTNSFSNGMKIGYSQMWLEMNNETQLGVQVMRDGIAAASDSFVEFATSGKKNFGEVAGSFAKMAASMLTQMAILKAIGFAFPSLVPTGAGAAVTPSAKGNAFENGTRISYFAKGGVMDQPFSFPMRNGMGIGAEAGPEAIMPLRRDSAGNLGVIAAGGKGGSNVSIGDINISVNGSSNGSQEQNTALANVIGNTVKTEVQQMVYSIIERESRNGGMLRRN